MAKKSVPKKNIVPALMDIKKPRFTYTASLAKREVNLRFAPKVVYRHQFTNKLYLWMGIAGIVAIALGVSAFMFYPALLNSKQFLVGASGEMSQNFATAATAFSNLDLDTALQVLQKNEKLIVQAEEELTKNPNGILVGALQNVVPLVGEVKALFSATHKFNGDLLNLSVALQNLQTNGLHDFFSDGAALMSSLNSLRTLVQTTSHDMETIKNATAGLRMTADIFGKLDDAVSNAYVKHSADLYQINNFLGNLSALLSSEEGKHVLVFFQNPAEIRPGGGFIGSYADLTIAGGQMQNLDVRDIYDPDGQFVRKVVPPWPLQTMTQDWGARDANWFFDFPTSARTVIDFLETSKMYAEKVETFEGAVAMNINVLQSILEITGPIQLPEYKLTITQSNFLNEIQREVEAGNDKTAGQPKRILKTLTPLLLEKFQNLDAREKKLFIEKLKAHLAAKDIMVFMKDNGMAEFLAARNLDGAVYALPNDFWGTYLAVVNANVAGGKSDTFINQSISGEIDVDTEGGSFVNLKVARAHTGDKEKDPWWRATNKDFIQVYTNPDARLTGIKGNDVKRETSDFDYTAAHYEQQADLHAIEATKVFFENFKAWSLQAFGKTAFATWLITPAGGVKTLEMHYQIPKTISVALDTGTVYKFVFEKQSGVQTSLKLDIMAPFGYHWVESESATYHFENQSPEKRAMLNLTLEKNSA